MALKRGLSQTQISIYSELKSRWNILTMSENYQNAWFDSQHFIFVKQRLLRWQQPEQDYGVDMIYSTHFRHHHSLPSLQSQMDCLVSKKQDKLPYDFELLWVIYLFHCILQCNNNGNKVHNTYNVFETISSLLSVC